MYKKEYDIFISYRRDTGEDSQYQYFDLTKRDSMMDLADLAQKYCICKMALVNK